MFNKNNSNDFLHGKLRTDLCAVSLKAMGVGVLKVDV